MQRTKYQYTNYIYLVYTLNDNVIFLFNSQQLAASVILESYRGKVLLCLLQVQVFTYTSSTFV